MFGGRILVRIRHSCNHVVFDSFSVSSKVFRWDERKEKSSGRFETRAQVDEFYAEQMKAKEKAVALENKARDHIEEERAREDRERSQIIAVADDASAVSPWRGRDLKVIVKVSHL